MLEGRGNTPGTVPGQAVRVRRAKTLLGGAKAIARALEPELGERAREHLAAIRAAVLQVPRPSSSSDFGALAQVDPRALAEGVCVRARERACAR